MHFKTVCSDCGTIVAQCRCPSLQKRVDYVLCDVCSSRRESPKPDEARDRIEAETIAAVVAWIEIEADDRGPTLAAHTWREVAAAIRCGDWRPK